MTERYRRNVSRKKRREKSGGGGIVLFLLSAFAVSMCFPQVRNAAKEKLTDTVLGNVDYRGVVSALSDGIRGETSIKDTFSNIVQCISKKDKNAVLVSTMPDGVSEVKAETETDKEAIVSAFIESKSEFDGLELPSMTTYQFPELSLEHISPMSGTVTSAFGYRHHPISGDVAFHYGMDIGGREGNTIVSFADGTVTSVSDSSTYGKNVTVTHESGVETMYAHCSEITVKVGDTVKMGDAIAKCGSTGNATSACLHFELKMNCVYVNPAYYI